MVDALREKPFNGVGECALTRTIGPINNDAFTSGCEIKDNWQTCSSEALDIHLPKLYHVAYTLRSLSSSFNSLATETFPSDARRVLMASMLPLSTPESSPA